MNKYGKPDPILPRFDDEGRFIVWEHPRQDGQMSYIPAKQIKLILENYDSGKDFKVISPLYPITRAQLAYIVTQREVFNSAPNLEAGLRERS
jgi:hypothetical protein